LDVFEIGMATLLMQLEDDRNDQGTTKLASA
jgi:hypothetical protein